MKRIRIAPRPDWQQKLNALGFDWHTAEEPAAPYWDESAYWELTAAEVDVLETATEDLHRMCLEATEQAIKRKLLPHFGFTEAAVRLIEDSWARRDEQPSLYGRFDLAFTGGDAAPKMLEYNADTPTGLYEASVVQWSWLEESFPERDQFNSIHEGLVAGWAKIHPRTDAAIHFTCLMPHAEDEGTLRYILDTALEAGLGGKMINVADIGWSTPAEGVKDARAGWFVDLEDQPITTLFKIVPWDWLLADKFGQELEAAVRGRTLTVIEPAWKMVPASKAILALLWEMFPDHPNLAPTFLTRQGFAEGTTVVAKPLLGREGANISIARLGADGAIDGDPLASLPGDYGQEGYVFQALVPVAEADGNKAVIGSWIIDGQSRGIGIREDQGLITHNRSRFVPHLFD